MAILNRASKISARPQIKAVKQPIPRQVILPKKAPAKASGIAMPTNVTPRQNVPVSPAEAQRIMNMQKAPSIPMMAQPLPMTPQPSFSLTKEQLDRIQGRPLVPNQPQYPTNNGFDAYGFDSGLVDYLNNQKQMSYTDGGVSYNYDPATQTFTGGTRGGPVTMTLAEMQAQAQNYNPMRGGQFETMPMGNGFGQPQMPMVGVGMAGANNIAPTLAQNTANNQMYGEQLPLGGNPMFNPMYNAPDINNPLFAGFSAPNPMANPMYNAPDVNNPLFAGFSAPMPNNMNQQGFVPMGGNNPQNTSTGSFGSIQQPMGGVGNIGSLLGKG